MCAKMQPHGTRLGLSNRPSLLPTAVPLGFAVSGPGSAVRILGIIAREMELDIASATYTPDIVEHLPGVSNKAADLLSRRSQPGKVLSLPLYLTPETENLVDDRPISWCKAMPA